MQNNIFFITGIGTGVGKTVAAAIAAEALQANYWKPVQCGFEDGTDNFTVQNLLSNKQSICFDEVYKLETPASPHIAAQKENITIDIEKIREAFEKINEDKPLVIEGAGGIMVPLNENEFVIDLIKKLHAIIILVSRNYLGSINHSLLTAALCRQNNLPVAGWIFNDVFMNYEDEIVAWTGYRKLMSIPYCESITKDFILQQAALLKHVLHEV